MDVNQSPSFTSPVLAGIITSASNPYWLSAGNGLIMEGLKTGLAAAGFFVIGHWMADAGWYTLVSSSTSRGKSLMSARTYRSLLTGCGAFLIVFGFRFIIRQFI